MLWMQNTLSSSLPNSSSCRSTFQYYVLFQTVPSHQYQFCWINNLHKGRKTRRKTVHPLVQLHFNKSNKLGPYESLKPRKIPKQLAKIEFLQRKTRKYLFGQFFNICSCPKMAKKVLREEKIHYLLAKHHTEQWFNLTPAPW